jgi:hypothetical protein
MSAEMTDNSPELIDLRERVIWVINDFVDTWRKYPYLEKRTGIPARRWQNVCNRVQQPSIEMLAALGEYRPHLIAWMLTGHGVNERQVSPITELPPLEGLH